MIDGTSTFLILLVALLLDRVIGDPDWLWRRLPHPVVLFGNAISFAEKRFNRPEIAASQREKYGFITIAILLISSVVIGAFFSAVFSWGGLVGIVIETVIVAVFLAQKSLADHVGAVSAGLRKDGVEGGRKAVSMIVGRNAATLDEAGVARAAIESLAENASDGVIAPAFWYAIFGLPGLFAYKMLNTADSMIGHMSERYRAFGRASAKFDDFANWVPARLTGGLIILGGELNNIEDNFRVMIRDAKLHRSPNAGWPESAMAAVCNLALGGPRNYAGGDIADEPFMNDVGDKNANADDIDHAIGVFWRAMTLATIAVALLALLAFLNF
ncbi:MAG: adenosylcobinamide-phosphate synthase CbiB [Ahrensia sp.]|nr:adenosylcobinamide-phosphate synthase CbiB [Ahrensia sp.]